MEKGKQSYSSSNMPPRLRLPALAFAPLVVFGVAFLVIPLAGFLRGVLGLDLALEMLKWLLDPEALALARILTMRSEIARGVGRSWPVAEVIFVSMKMMRGFVRAAYAIFRKSRRTWGKRQRSRGF